MISNVNIPNSAMQIANLPVNSVVETNAVFDRDCIRPIFAGELPTNVRDLILPHIKNHERIMRASLTGDRELVKIAFEEDPLLRGHGISKKDISVLVDDMIVNTSRYLPEYWR